ncbi:unnamed protein product [Ostreobium quekettii]|uniref:Uncharacterized protein n=1 Tax=Ostreobium quekettii TaxID=121088 RepID=A0A8S1J204_9CHLO|nr:unnamed protein product [Ostreobium quekettii]
MPMASGCHPTWSCQSRTWDGSHQMHRCAKWTGRACSRLHRACPPHAAGQHSGNQCQKMCPQSRLMPKTYDPHLFSQYWALHLCLCGQDSPVLVDLSENNRGEDCAYVCIKAPFFSQEGLKSPKFITMVGINRGIDATVLKHIATVDPVLFLAVVNEV